MKKNGRVLQVIFGCGRIGYAVAKELKKRELDLDILIVDIDEKKVEVLLEEDFTAFVGDIRDPETTDKIISAGEPEVVFIVSNDSEGNKKAVSNIKEKVPGALLIVRAVDPADKEDLKALDVDLVLSIPDIAARTAIEQLARAKSMRKVKELTSMIGELKDKEAGKLGIVVHDTPDPDAIASAFALRQISKHVGVPADILYQGDVGHHVNRAFLNILGIEMIQIKNRDDLKSYGMLALVDATVPGEHNPLPQHTEGNGNSNSSSNLKIIIDHHSASNTKEKISAEFLAILPDNGSTSTIMTRYLQDLGIPVDKVLATALLHGIRTDTCSFKRGTHPSDFSAASFLHLKADKDLLEQIETPPMSTEMLNVVGNAILRKKIKGSYLITNVGEVANLDAIPQAADYLLNLEGISTVVVIGLVEDMIYVSGRSKDIRVNIGDSFVRAFGDLGSAGGHSSMAAAQIPLGIFGGSKNKDTIIELVEDAVSKRFLSVMKEEMSE